MAHRGKCGSRKTVTSVSGAGTNAVGLPPRKMHKKAWGQVLFSFKDFTHCHVEMSARTVLAAKLTGISDEADGPVARMAKCCQFLSSLPE